MKTRIKSYLFAFLLVATNWQWSSETRSADITTGFRIDAPGIWVLICSIALVVMLVKLYKLIRLLLDGETRVPLDLKLIALGPIGVLLLLFAWVGSTLTTTVNGTSTTITRGYGSHSSAQLFVIAALLIIVFQLRNGLRDYRSNLGNTPRKTE